MLKANSSTDTQSERSIVITRIFNAPRELVFKASTQRYESIPNSDRLNTLTLTEQDGKTTLHIHIQHQSQEQRDGHLQSGMEAGLRETLNRLEELLQSMS